jgi:hypothetical protein
MVISSRRGPPIDPAAVDPAPSPGVDPAAATGADPVTVNLRHRQSTPARVRLCYASAVARVRAVSGRTAHGKRASSGATPLAGTSRRMTMRRVVLGLLAVGGLLSLFTPWALAQAKKPDATLTLSEGTVAVGIGFSWGKGSLSYQGKTYPVKVEGLSVGEVGIQRATATGEVFNLKKLEDFNGNFVAGGAGATVGGGAGITAMKNQNGVVIHLKSTTQGASLKLAAEGLKLSVQK